MNPPIRWTLYFMDEKDKLFLYTNKIKQRGNASKKRFAQASYPFKTAPIIFC